MRLKIGKKYAVSDQSGNVMTGVAISDYELALTGFLAVFMGEHRVLNMQRYYSCDITVEEVVEDEAKLSPPDSAHVILSGDL
jgi:hypothetical protein